MGRLDFLTIPAMLQASFKDFASHQSLVFVGEENRTYAQLEIDVKKAALQLQAIGVKKGDKVGILPVKYGASVHYLQKPPVASVLLAALKQVRPTIMLIVPLIVEIH